MSNSNWILNMFKQGGKDDKKKKEDKKIEIKESSKTFIPTTTKHLSDAEEADLVAMIDKMEEDDDVVAVYHNAR